MLGDVIVIDELLAGAKCRSPVRVHIPRKPHPNGHLYYFAAIKLDNCDRWFILYIDPFLKKNERPSFTSTFKTLLDPVAKLEINVVADNKFATLDNLAYCFENNINFTMGLALNNLKEITSSTSKEVVQYKDYDVLFHENKNLYLLYEIGTNDNPFKIISHGMVQNGTGHQSAKFSGIKRVYKEYFNGVDVFNKVFYSFRWKHRHFKWTSQVLDDALSIAISNSFALYCSNNTKKI